MLTAANRQIDQVELIELPTRFPVGPVNVYLIEGEKLTLVDTSPNLSENYRLLNDMLHQRGYDIREIEQVVLTHHHVDHVGLLDRILEVNPVLVYGHPNCRVWLRQGEQFVQWYVGFFEEFLSYFGVPQEFHDEIHMYYQRMEQLSCHTDLDGELFEGDTVPGLPDWRVIETKGHAQSHIALYREKDQVLISGDHIIKHISSNALIEPPQNPGEPRVKTLIQYRENLQKCAEMPVELTLTGHGTYVEDVKALVQKRFQEMEERASRIREIIGDDSKTGFQIVQELFPTKYQNQLMLTVSETVGHLDLLLERGEVVEEKKDGISYFRAVK